MENDLQANTETLMQICTDTVSYSHLFEGLKTAITSDDSRMINFDERPKVIISASGMCEAGRDVYKRQVCYRKTSCSILKS